MVFFNHYCLLTRLLSFACQEALSVLITTRGAKCLRTLCSYQEVSLCLISQVTLRSSTSASSIVCLAKSHLRSTTSHICLSQAYGCSDRYISVEYSHVYLGDEGSVTKVRRLQGRGIGEHMLETPRVSENLPIESAVP